MNDDDARSTAEPRRPALWRVRNVWVLGVASLLNDVASEMVVPLLPVFLATTLGGGAVALGLIEGTADLVASVLKWASGRASDRFGVTRPFVLAGYGLAALSRPFLALATAPGHVLAVRVVDRVGKGLRTAPRDALLGASVAPAHRGAAFGFHRSMDHAGAAIGPALALVVLTLWTRDLRVLFLLAAIPGFLAALVIPLTREVAPAPRPTTAPAVPPAVWRFLVPVALVTFGTASDAFLMLKAGVADHAPLEALPILWVLLHLVRSAVATPAGWLADRVEARWVVAAGWGWRAVIFAFFAAVSDPWLGAAGVVAYGLAATSEAAEKRLVAAAVGTEKTGTAFGVYHGTIGLATLPGALVFGLLWETQGPGTAWGVAAMVVAAAVAVLVLAAPRRGSTPA